MGAYSKWMTELERAANFEKAISQFYFQERKVVVGVVHAGILFSWFFSPTKRKKQNKATKLLRGSFLLCSRDVMIPAPIVLMITPI